MAPGSKEKWPELVGKDGSVARTVIEKDLPGVDAVLLPEDSMVTMDYQLKRVRIFVDTQGNVAVAPRVG